MNIDCESKQQVSRSPELDHRIGKEGVNLAPGQDLASMYHVGKLSDELFQQENFKSAMSQNGRCQGGDVTVGNDVLGLDRKSDCSAV